MIQSYLPGGANSRRTADSCWTHRIVSSLLRNGSSVVRLLVGSHTMTTDVSCWMVQEDNPA